MEGILSRLCDTEKVTPHGWRLTLRPDLICAFVLSDGLIAAAYFPIPIYLIELARRRRDIPLQYAFLLFATFVFLCGATHIGEIVMLWVPAYGLAVVRGGASAAIPIATAAALWMSLPRALALPGLNR